MIERRLCASAALVGVLALMGCVTQPGSELHKGFGKTEGQGSVALTVWLPSHVKGPLWLQFERRNAQGRPTGIPVSILLDAPQQPMREALPPRAGWRGHILALPLPPGGFVVSRWLGDIDGKGVATTSAYIGWSFDVTAGQLTHLGHLSLDIAAPADGVVNYSMRANDATAADVDLAKVHFEALRQQTWLATSLSNGTVASGTAMQGGTSRVLTPNTINYYQYR